MINKSISINKKHKYKYWFLVNLSLKKKKLKLDNLSYETFNEYQLEVEVWKIYLFI